MTSELQRERLAYRRSRARRSTLVALASTTVFAAVGYLAITEAPGWPASATRSSTGTSPSPPCPPSPRACG
ncbi:hypothetical protein ACFQV2_14990 [Actinokineospora soli]|uniref:Uncharacterized protein n=1 Tax=Actinokineospora soli TaxID=1048753 RepID=A0ABW2TND2_9PSEU